MFELVDDHFGVCHAAELACFCVDASVADDVFFVGCGFVGCGDGQGSDVSLGLGCGSCSSFVCDGVELLNGLCAAVDECVEVCVDV